MTDNEGFADGDEEDAVGNAAGADGTVDAAGGGATDAAGEAAGAAEDATAADDGAEDADADEAAGVGTEAEATDPEAEPTESDADATGAETQARETEAGESEADEGETDEAATTEVDSHDAEADDADSGDGEADVADTGDADADVADADEFDAEAAGGREELAELIASTDPEVVADELAGLRDRVDSLEVERDDLESRLKRKQAEFQNYKKRQEKRREEERRRATEDLVERLLDVRDNLQRALETDEDADIRSGVETTMRQFDRVLDAENVQRIDPEPGDEVDPQRHEVLMRVESDREPGTVDKLHRPGYEMAGKLLRAAQVTVADAADD